MYEFRHLVLGACTFVLGALIVSGCAGGIRPAQTEPALLASTPVANVPAVTAQATRQMNGIPTVSSLSTPTLVPAAPPSVLVAPTEVAMQQTKSAPKVDESQFKKAPPLESGTWINSPPLTLDRLRGHVVIVSFWTFAFYNCQNTLPYSTSWDQKYRDRGLVIIGVHTPELSFERDVANVKQAVHDDGLQYPIAIDGDYANWNRYHVQAWPTWFILDKEGYIRYSHVGEGDYTGTERTIAALLQE